MKKLNPNDVADSFEHEITRLIDYYSRSSSSLAGSPTEKSDTSLLTEHVFLAVAISFEGALSDIYFAYTNIDSSVFVSKKETQIKESVKKEFGQWYADKFNLGTIKHIKTADLYPLLDPRGHNITFYDGKTMVDKAKKNLTAGHSAKYTALNPSQIKLMNAAKFIRNCVAHRSESSYDAMTDALEKLLSGTFKGLGRKRDKKVQSIGAYLKSAVNPGNAQTRLEVYLTGMKDIVVALGR